ncbi:MAG: ATP-binding protein [Deltaproteobacteria bacterium]|nr:ATP-binding protein [Deltaproteobacteria bacterium]
MDAGTRQRLLGLNPWLSDPARFAQEIARRVPERFIPRKIDPTGFDDPRKAKLIVGPRQSGKSTFVWTLLKDRSPVTVLHLNCEDSLVRNWCGSAAGMLTDLETEFRGIKTIFFEEAQHLQSAGLLVKGLVDARRAFDLLVTGSSTYHLDANVRESLAGRAERRLVLPFSLSEIAGAEKGGVPAVKIARKAATAARMLEIGGYPDVYLGADPVHELAGLLEALVIRDVSDRHRIARPDAFRTLLRLAAGQTGSLVNFAEWASHAGVSASTVANYLNILEESWDVKLLPVFAGGRRLEITSARKIYFFDIGIRNALLGRFDPLEQRGADSGPLVEGFVFTEITKSIPSSWTVHYWRSKGGAEVDFVLVSGSGIVAVEVKTGPVRGIPRSLRSFIDAYSPHTALLVSPSVTDPVSEKVAETRVVRVPISEVGAKVEELCGLPN